MVISETVIKILKRKGKAIQAVADGTLETIHVEASHSRSVIQYQLEVAEGNRLNNDIATATDG